MCENGQVIAWDDLRTFLVVAREGSFASAGRALGLKHTTVARRVASLEADLGVRLVDRTPDGAAPTAAGRALVARAAGLESTVYDLELLARGRDARLEGPVRLATSGVLAEGIVCRHLAGLRARLPGVELDVLSGQAFVDLGRRQADLALRTVFAGGPPGGPGFVARRVGALVAAPYAARSYLAERPLEPGPALDLAGHAALGFGSAAPGGEDPPWFAAAARGANVVFRADSVQLLLTACAAGLGVAFLPTLLADREPRLVRLGRGVFEADTYCVVHPEVRRSRRVRAVFEWLVETASRALAA
jgi:DNA-binding transcriptional LysR family regulator